MTSYARARAESLIEKCKVGFMERPERIVLFMIGAFTDRMAGVLWVILTLSVITVANRIYYTYLALNRLPMPSTSGAAGAFWRFFFWRDERATLAYDIWVIAILAFVWLTPPDWLRDPTASGLGLLGFLLRVAAVSGRRRLRPDDLAVAALSHDAFRFRATAFGPATAWGSWPRLSGRSWRLGSTLAVFFLPALTWSRLRRSASIRSITLGGPLPSARRPLRRPPSRR